MIIMVIEGIFRRCLEEDVNFFSLKTSTLYKRIFNIKNLPFFLQLLHKVSIFVHICERIERHFENKNTIAAHCPPKVYALWIQYNS